MACFHVGQAVSLHYRSAVVHGTITKVVKQGATCASSQFMVHETHTTVDGRKLVHDKMHYGSALHAEG